MNPYKMVITVANQKGGCSKTTTAVNIATALAKGDPKNGWPEAKVLLVDMDPQGNVSTSFGIQKNNLGRTVYDLLMNDLEEELPIMLQRKVHEVRPQLVAPKCVPVTSVSASM